VIASPRQDSGDPRAVFRFAAHPTSVGAVRRETREELYRWGLTSEVCDDVVLIVSELVTNAIVHTVSDTVTCRLRGGREIYVEVGSEGPSGSRGDVRSADEGGRGLLVVESLSTTWGINVASPGAGWTAWATLTVPVPSPVPASAAVSAWVATHGQDAR
jgi:anti-sigma regulatory factor (Ser/Thr protein kinase)